MRREGIVFRCHARFEPSFLSDQLIALFLKPRVRMASIRANSGFYGAPPEFLRAQSLCYLITCPCTSVPEAEYPGHEIANAPVPGPPTVAVAVAVKFTVEPSCSVPVPDTRTLFVSPSKNEGGGSGEFR
jgi:hypothetical protein